MNTQIPLAERLRPKSLDEFVGQEHLVGKGKPLRNMIESGSFPSIILWGPPGVGKTTLAQILAQSANRPFHFLSAIEAGVKDLREIIQSAKGLFPPVLFIDEIHRFNKSQQDALLGAVEKGRISLIGATTENPSFEINSALLSRCQVLVLEQHSPEHLNDLLNRAIQSDDWLKNQKIIVSETNDLFKFSGGDARKLLNLLEAVVFSILPEKKKTITNALVQKVAANNFSRYDKSGEQHYDVISAFIKSIRGSDPQAAVYWLARMIHGGEDPKFIARRMLILASEDIGNANPTAMILANNTFQAVHQVGMPESRIILSQCAIYLACSTKSNSSYLAIDLALEEVRKNPNLEVPLHLRNSPTKLMKQLGYGEGYLYAHHYENNFVRQSFLPSELENQEFFTPGKNPREQEMQQFLDKRWGKSSNEPK
jgi:putative ATPase